MKNDTNGAEPKVDSMAGSAPVGYCENHGERQGHPGRSDCRLCGKRLTKKPNATDEARSKTKGEL